MRVSRGPRALLPVWLMIFAVLALVVACGEEDDFGSGQASGSSPTATTVEEAGDPTPSPAEDVATPTLIPEDVAPDTTPPEDPFMQQVLEEQARIYADAVDISLEEALERLSRPDVVGDLPARLEADERDTYAGAFIQHSPEYRFVVFFTRDGEETIRKYVEEGSELDDFVEVREARFSLVKLQEIRDEADQIIGQLEYFNVSSGTSVTENQVQYYVYNSEQAEAMLAELGLELPEGAVFVGDGPPVSFDPPDQVPGVYMAIRKPTLGPMAYPDALLTGMLVLSDGCIRIETDFDGGPLLPVWPHDFRLRTEGDRIEILNGAGEVVARVGEPIYVGGAGGSSTGDRINDEGLHHPVPEPCQFDGVWGVGSIDPLDDQPVLPTPVADGAPLGLHTVQWPDDVENIQALLAAIPDNLNDSNLPRWDGPAEEGRFEVGFGSPDDVNHLRFTVIDLTSGTYYPDFWTVNDLIASRFMSDYGMSSGFSDGLSWATEDTSESGRNDAVYPDVALHTFHWGNDSATWLFSAYATDKMLLEQLVVAIVAAGGM